MKVRISYGSMRRHHGIGRSSSLVSVVAIGMAAVYATLVSVAATCGFMPAHDGVAHAHHAVASSLGEGSHAEHTHSMLPTEGMSDTALAETLAADAASGEPTAPPSSVHSLCAWACQASTSSLFGIALPGAPLLVAQATVALPDAAPSTSLFAEFPTVRGPPL